MIVVDVNVVAYCFIAGERTAQAREVLRRDPDWRLPALWRHEYLNVLATFVRQGGATIDEARVVWRRTVELVGAREHGVDMEAALALASEHRLSAYDAQYLVLARQLQTICVTEDKRLLKTFPSLTSTMEVRRDLISDSTPHSFARPICRREKGRNRHVGCSCQSASVGGSSV